MESQSTDISNEKLTGFRFGFHLLFYPILLLAVGMAISLSLIVPTIIIAIVWLGFTNSERKHDLFIATSLVGLALLLGLAMSFFFHAFSKNEITERRSGLRQIAHGALSYESAYAEFISNSPKVSNGEFPVSWRVKVLPFVEQWSNEPLDYRYDEPWDSPHNIQLRDELPFTFKCLGHGLGNKTPYKLIVGSGSAVGMGGVTGAGKMPVDVANTIFLVEDIANPVYWTEPDGLAIEDAIVLLNDMTKEQCSNKFSKGLFHYYYGIGVATVDGAVHMRPFKPRAALDRSWFTLEDDGKQAGIYVFEGFPYFEIAFFGPLLGGIYVLLSFFPAVKLFLYQRKIASRELAD